MCVYTAGMVEKVTISAPTYDYVPPELVSFYVLDMYARCPLCV